MYQPHLINMLMTNIVERMSYAAFGERRKGDWRASDPLLPIIPALTNRGFTGHEHIDEMGLIHNR
jgi:hypothetical protein